MGFPSARYPPSFFPSLYFNLNHFYKMFYSGTPYLQRHPYAITIFGFLTSRYPPLDFSRLSTPILTILTKVITQALPTYNVIPNLHALHTLKFWSMSGSILLLRHYQTQPPPIRQHHFPIPLLALPTPRFFPASLPQIKTFLQNVLLRQYQPPSSPLRQHCIRIPLLALPTPRFFPASTSFQQR